MGSKHAPLYLDAQTAADLMMPNPISINEKASIQDAIAVLTDRGFSGAPVIDEAGRPVGVVSRSDILRHDRERPMYAHPVSDYYMHAETVLSSGERLPHGFQVEEGDTTTVGDIMTPVVFAVAPESSATTVVEEFLERKVHRLFVVDRGGALIGVISALDVLRRLRGLV